MFKYFCTIFFTILSLNVFATEATGGIKGSVSDSKNNSPLTGVVITVTVAGVPKGAITDIDGKYELAGLPAGDYELSFSYITYTTQKQNVKITAGNDAFLDIKLVPEANELKEQVVKSGRITGTENSVINEIKTSSLILSGTSASQISKTLDRSAADVVKRIPGVTIQDDRFIVIRGLSDRYNTVWLNDAGTPSSEADKKSFSFDIIPAGLIDRVLIFKTPSPDLPGDFAGGMVKVYTTSLADKNQLTVSLQTSSREFTTGTNFNYNTPGKTDWLGYDDGKRNIPKGIPDLISTTDPKYNDNIAGWSKSFGNDWAVNSKKTSPDARFSLAMSNVWKLKTIKIGNTLGIAYANTYANYNIHRQGWDSTALNYNYIDQRSAHNISAGFMDNVGVTIGNSKIEFKNLYNQIGTSSITLRNAIPDTINHINPERSYKMEYESRATYAAQLLGSHKNKTDTRKYTWALGYTDMFKNQPDRRIIKYTKSDIGFDTVYKAQVPSQPDILNGGRYYAALFEHTYSFNHQFTQKVSINDFSFDVSAGNYIEYKARSLNIRELGYSIKSGALAQTILKYPINSIFADSNVDGLNKFKIGEITHSYDHYEAQNELIASFISLKVPIGSRFSIFGGVRYEYNMQSLRSVVNLDTVNVDLKTKFLLPSVNASYNFTDKSLVRAAYGKTLNRPEFREFAPSYYYDFDELVGLYGSLFGTPVSKNKPKGDTLKVGEVQNVDVRYEFYPSAGEMIQIGGFYKSFTNPIQRVIIVTGGSDSKGVTFINANSAYCYGLELDLRKNLGWIDAKFGTNIFKDFTLVSNLSLTKSELTIDSSSKTGVSSAIPKSDLQGQSHYVVNAGVYYQSLQSGFQGSLLYNVYGARMYAVGTTVAGGESIGEMPFQSFDLTVSKLVHKHFIINVGVQNLLNSRVVFMEDINRDNKFDSKHDAEYKTYYPGRYYTLGVKIKF